MDCLLLPGMGGILIQSNRVLLAGHPGDIHAGGGGAATDSTDRRCETLRIDAPARNIITAVLLSLLVSMFFVGAHRAQ